MEVEVGIEAALGLFGLLLLGLTAFASAIFTRKKYGRKKQAVAVDGVEAAHEAAVEEEADAVHAARERFEEAAAELNEVADMDDNTRSDALADRLNRDS